MNHLEWTIIIVIVVVILSVIMQALTAPKSADITGAEWECAQCSMPSSACKTTTKLEYNCTWTCVDMTINKTTYETTKCTKWIMVKYLEVGG